MSVVAPSLDTIRGGTRPRTRGSGPRRALCERRPAALGGHSALLEASHNTRGAPRYQPGLICCAGETLCGGTELSFAFCNNPRSSVKRRNQPWFAGHNQPPRGSTT